MTPNAVLVERALISGWRWPAPSLWMPLAALALAAAVPAQAERYEVGPDSAELRYVVDGMVGIFRDYEAQLDIDPENLPNSRLHVTVAVASADMQNPLVNRYLKGRAFFDARRHPTAQFQSTGVTPKPPAALEVAGTLEVRGQQQPVTLAVEVLDDAGLGAFAAGEPVSIRASTTVQRSLFGIDWELGQVADAVRVEIEGELRPR